MSCIVRLDTKEGEKELYLLGRQSDRARKDVQQVTVAKDKDASILTSEDSVEKVEGVLSGADK